MMSLRRINLNLLPVLLALLKTRSVSRAAEILCLSQGAVSNALSRLRETFGDPLLVRVGTHLELTRLASELIGPAEEQCAGLEALFTQHEFNPLTDQRTFVIACTDYATFLVAPALLNAINAIAPHVRLRFVDAGANLTGRMTERDIDVAIVGERHLEYTAHSRLNFIPLIEDKKVVMFCRDHPLSQLDSVEIADLAPYHAVLFHPSSDIIERKTRERILGGQHLDVMAYVPHLIVTPFMLLGTDHYTIVPELVARRIAQTIPLEIRRAIFDKDPLVVGVAWNRLHDTDLAHRWLLAVIRETSRSLISREFNPIAPQIVPMATLAEAPDHQSVE